MPDTGTPYNWRLPIGDDFFKGGFSAVRNLAADIAGTIGGLATRVTNVENGLINLPYGALPTLAADWNIGSDGAGISQYGRVVTFGAHLVRSNTAYTAGGVIFRLPASQQPRQMLWPVGLQFGNIQGELKIRPSHTPSGAAYGADAGGVSFGVNIPAGSGVVVAATFLVGGIA